MADKGGSVKHYLMLWFAVILQAIGVIYLASAINVHTAALEQEHSRITALTDRVDLHAQSLSVIEESLRILERRQARVLGEQ
jgi:hypothetical protein